VCADGTPAYPAGRGTQGPAFYKETFNVYLNYHRPCGFATKTVDEKGKIRKKHETYLAPFEKLSSLTWPKRFLKKGVLLE